MTVSTLITPFFGGAWVVQLVKCLTLDSSSGHDLIVCEMEPRIRLHADSAQNLLGLLSPSLSSPSPTRRHAFPLALSK